MRRKVLQDFANLFCQRMIDLPSGYDLASFAHHGSGTYRANILTGECSLNGRPIPALRTCDDHKEWLNAQLDKHGIQGEGIKEVSLLINVKVDKVNVKSSFGHQSAHAHFSFDCHSEIRTDEKSYTGNMAGEKRPGDLIGITFVCTEACRRLGRPRPTTLLGEVRNCLKFIEKKRPLRRMARPRGRS